MELSPSLVRERAEAYAAEEPLHTVEVEQIETLPGAFASGEFGWRDAAWVVRWYFRRFLGDYPDRDRRATEDAFGENDLETIHSVMADVLAATGVRKKLGRLADLSGVDVRVGSAFLAFAEPDEHLVLGERTWAVLHASGALPTPYPEEPAPADYETFLEAGRSVAEGLDVDLWTLYRALWRLYGDL